MEGRGTTPLTPAGSLPRFFQQNVSMDVRQRGLPTIFDRNSAAMVREDRSHRSHMQQYHHHQQQQPSIQQYQHHHQQQPSIQQYQHHHQQQPSFQQYHHHQQQPSFQQRNHSQIKMQNGPSACYQKQMPLGVVGGERSLGSSSSPGSSTTICSGSDSVSYSEENIGRTQQRPLNRISRSPSFIQGVRLTLKMGVSYLDHSFLIGCKGSKIRKVMRDTRCHIHFPDSNKDESNFKSNQVNISGSCLADVERARSRIRELSPLIFHFNLPIACDTDCINPEQYYVFIDNMQAKYRVQVILQSPNQHQSTTSLTVKGREIDAPAVIEAATKTLDYFWSVFGAGRMNAVLVETIMDITPSQHHYVRSFNDTNVKMIARNTETTIIFPDLSDPNLPELKKSRVVIRGDINCVYRARQQIIESLPIRLIFTLPDGHPLNADQVTWINVNLNVTVKVSKNANNKNMEMESNSQMGDLRVPRLGLVNRIHPISPRQSALSANLNNECPRTVYLVASERNAPNIYEATQKIFGEHSFPAAIPQAYQTRPADIFFPPEASYASDEDELDQPLSLSMLLPPPPGFETPPASPEVPVKEPGNTVGPLTNNVFQYHSKSGISESDPDQLVMELLSDNFESILSYK